MKRNEQKPSQPGQTGRWQLLRKGWLFPKQT